MKSLLTSQCLALDLESTGVKVFEDRIVTACAAIVEAGRVVFEREWLLAVEVDIPAEAEKVHGVSTAHAREHGVDPAQGVKEIANAIRYAVHSNLPVVAFNAAFDLSMLNAECVRVGLGTLEEFCGRPIRPVVDPHVVDRATDRFRKGSRQLTDTCAHYDVTLSDEDAHTAGADAVAAARVAYRLAERAAMLPDAVFDLYADRRKPRELVGAFETLGRLSLDQIHDAQVGWYRELTESRGDFWVKKAHALRIQAATLVDRIEECDDPTERDDLDKQRAAAEAEADDLDGRVAGLDTEWPLRSLPVAVTQ